MVCFVKDRTPGVALNLLLASWFSLFPSNYAASSSGGEPASLSGTPGAPARGVGDGSGFGSGSVSVTHSAPKLSLGSP